MTPTTNDRILEVIKDIMLPTIIHIVIAATKGGRMYLSVAFKTYISNFPNIHGIQNKTEKI